MNSELILSLLPHWFRILNQANTGAEVLAILDMIVEDVSNTIED